MILTVFALPLLLMSIIYLRIFIIISKHQKGRRLNHERSTLSRGVITATAPIGSAAAVNLPDLMSKTGSVKCPACVAMALQDDEDPTISILSEETSSSKGNDVPTNVGQDNKRTMDVFERSGDRSTAQATSNLFSWPHSTPKHENLSLIKPDATTVGTPSDSSLSSGDNPHHEAQVSSPSNVDCFGGNKNADTPGNCDKSNGKILHVELEEYANNDNEKKDKAAHQEKALSFLLDNVDNNGASPASSSKSRRKRTIQASSDSESTAKGAAIADYSSAGDSGNETNLGEKLSSLRINSCKSYVKRHREALKAKFSLGPEATQSASCRLAQPPAPAAASGQRSRRIYKRWPDRFQFSLDQEAPNQSQNKGLPQQQSHQHKGAKQQPNESNGNLSAGECTCDNKLKQSSVKLSRANTIGFKVQRATTRWSSSSKPRAVVTLSNSQRSSISSAIATSSLRLQLRRSPTSASGSQIIQQSDTRSNTAGSVITSASVAPDFSVATTNVTTTSSTYEPQRRHIHASAVPQTNTKALVTTLLILGTYFISYAPAIIYQVLTCIDHCPYPLYDISFSRRVLFGAMTTLLLIAKSIIDPFIYSYRMSEIQVAISRYLSKRRSSLATSMYTSQKFNLGTTGGGPGSNIPYYQNNHQFSTSQANSSFKMLSGTNASIRGAALRTTSNTLRNSNNQLNNKQVNSSSVNDSNSNNNNNKQQQSTVIKHNEKDLDCDTNLNRLEADTRLQKDIIEVIKKENRHKDVRQQKYASNINGNTKFNLSGEPRGTTTAAGQSNNIPVNEATSLLMKQELDGSSKQCNGGTVTEIVGSAETGKLAPIDSIPLDTSVDSTSNVSKLFC